MDTITMRFRAESSEENFTIQPLEEEEVEVCANNPRLRMVYDRAASLGFTTVADSIARVCERLEGKT